MNKNYKGADKFSKAEAKGRNIMNTILLNNSKNNNIKFTETKFDRVDVFWEKNNKKYVGEIKYRYYDSDVDFIENEGLLLEKTKYDELKRIQNESGMTPFYISIMQDGNIFLFDLTSNQCPAWEEREFPKDSQYHQDEKVMKVVTFLDVKDAKKVKYNV